MSTDKKDRVEKTWVEIAHRNCLVSHSSKVVEEGDTPDHLFTEQVLQLRYPRSRHHRPAAWADLRGFSQATERYSRLDDSDRPTGMQQRGS
jgi:hypothetical protein